MQVVRASGVRAGRPKQQAGRWNDAAQAERSPEALQVAPPPPLVLAPHPPNSAVHSASAVVERTSLCAGSAASFSLAWGRTGGERGDEMAGGAQPLGGC